MPDGKHDVEVSKTVTKNVLTKVFEHLKKENVNLELMVLKPNMVTPGSGNEESEKDDLKVAEYTQRGVVSVRARGSTGDSILIRRSIRRRGQSKVEFNAQDAKGVRQNVPVDAFV